MNLNKASLIECRSEEIANTSLDAEDGLRCSCSKVDYPVRESCTVRDGALPGSLEFVRLVMNTQLGFLNGEGNWDTSVVDRFWVCVPYQAQHALRLCEGG